MLNKIIIANFKAEFTKRQIISWLDFFAENYQKTNIDNKIVIFAPSFIHLEYFKEQIIKKQLPVFLSAQDMSEYSLGKYTGEIPANALKDYVDYVLLGHSERRVLRGETIANIQKKIIQANEIDLKVILCLEKPESYSGRVDYLAYEPVSAIGTGIPADPSVSWQETEQIRALFQSIPCLYGGSINNLNAKTFIDKGFEGLLVGKSTLNCSEFIKILENA